MWVLTAVLVLTLHLSTFAVDENPRVFITDSNSWETSGSAAGSGGTFAAETHGGARPQTAEIIKTFGERCPSVTVNNLQAKADYIVLLDHEGGKGYLRHRNKVVVFDHYTGDTIVSKSTLSVGGSVQDACEAITKHWTEHAAEMRTTASPSPKPQGLDATPSGAELRPAGSATPKLTVASTPDGADIEVDGSFMGSTPSVIEVTPGDHMLAIKKSGYDTWERKLKVTGGQVKVNAELEKKRQ